MSERRTAMRLAVLAWLVLATLGMDTLSEDDFVCENVAAKLDGCCDGFDVARMNCDYGGCNPPTISRNELDCIESMSCATIHERDLCNRVIAAIDNPESTDRLCH